MAEWRRVRLGDLFEVKHGFAFPGSGFSDDPMCPTLVTPANFRIGGGFKIAKAKTFSGDIPKEYVLDAGDLIVTMTDLSKSSDTLGLGAIVPGDTRYLHNQRIGLVVPKGDGYVPEFMNYYFRTAEYRSYIVGTASGSTVRHTSPTRIEDFVAVLPELNAQQAIADVLGALDDKIAANTKLATTADNLALALIGGLTPSVPLREIAEFKRRSISPIDVAESSVAHYSLPAFDATGRPETVEPATIKSGKFLVDAPSVLVSKLNPRFPRVWNVADLPDVPALASTEFVVLRPLFSSSTVLWSLVAQQRFGSALEGMVAGTSGSHQRVKPADMLEVLVPDPRTMPADLVARIEAVAASARSARHELPLLEGTRDALLPALMSGRLRVDEAVEVAGL